MIKNIKYLFFVAVLCSLVPLISSAQEELAPGKGGAVQGGPAPVVQQVPAPSQVSTALTSEPTKQPVSQDVQTSVSLENKVNMLMYAIAGGFSLLIIIIIILLLKLSRNKDGSVA